jgi:hypothetical protein
MRKPLLSIILPLAIALTRSVVLSRVPQQWGTGARNVLKPKWRNLLFYKTLSILELRRLSKL